MTTETDGKSNNTAKNVSDLIIIIINIIIIITIK